MAAKSAQLAGEGKHTLHRTGGGIIAYRLDSKTHDLNLGEGATTRAGKGNGVGKMFGSLVPSLALSASDLGTGYQQPKDNKTGAVEAVLRAGLGVAVFNALKAANLFTVDGTPAAHFSTSQAGLNVAHTIQQCCVAAGWVAKVAKTNKQTAPVAAATQAALDALDL